MDLSLYGSTGILGTYYKGLFPVVSIPRNQLEPSTDRVLYLISTTDNTTFKNNPYIDINTNLVALMHRLNQCRKYKIKEFNFVSSWFVYGASHEYPDETAVCDPNGFYSITKYAAEKLVVNYCKTFGINYRILRLGNVYGGPDSGNTKRNALHFLINKLKTNQDITVYINLSRDFIHILDTCRAIDLVCRTAEQNSIYNIGTGIGTRLGDCLDQAKRLLKSEGCVLRENIPDTYDQAIRFALDCSKLKSLGFKPLISVEEGLEDLCLNRKFCTPDLTLMEQRLKQLSVA